LIRVLGLLGFVLNEVEEGHLMTYRITILCENSVGPISGTLGEHGFSALLSGMAVHCFGTPDKGLPCCTMPSG
jgi:hypothetical protein